LLTGKGEKTSSNSSELVVKGSLARNGVKVSTRSDVDGLSSRGFGAVEDGSLILTFYEALYLMDKGTLQIKGKGKSNISFREVLECSEKLMENAWSQYLTYKDLRSRGYVVREGFGTGVDFRVYDRGEYSKDSAKYLVLSIQEGKPMTLQNLAKVVRQSESLKKELILAVLNRRGEVVYYSVSKLNLPQEKDA